MDGALSSARYQTVHIDLNKANPSSGTSTPPVLVTAGKNVQHGHNSCPIIETRKTPSAHDVYQKLVTPAIETKKPTFTQKRIIRGQNNDKPTGRKDLIKSALSSKHFYGETTCQASYKVIIFLRSLYKYTLNFSRIRILHTYQKRDSDQFGRIGW